MNQQPDEHPTERKITLPSGREVEVISTGATIGVQPDVCAQCGSELMQPISWQERHDSRWDLALECPNCAWIERGIYTRSQIEALEERLDQGVAAMLRDLKQLTRANMAADIERFIQALNSGLVVPEDF